MTTSYKQTMSINDHSYGRYYGDNAHLDVSWNPEDDDSAALEMKKSESDEIIKTYRKLRRQDDGINLIYNHEHTPKLLYTSGAFIRNAVTGVRSWFKVGSEHEDGYFKVAFAAGVCTSKNHSNLLFYESPAEYMEHFGIVVDSRTVEFWEQKRDAYHARMETARKIYSERQHKTIKTADGEVRNVIVVK